MSDKIQSESEAAHLFRLEYGDLIRFIPERGEWIVKDGNLWNLDGSKGVEALIREFLDRQTAADSRWRGSISVVRSVKAFLETVAALHVSATDLDAREELLGTGTGVYSLKRLKYVSPRAGTYVTKRTSVDPGDDTDCPRWRKFLRQVFKKDEEKIAYFQRFCGYLLTGSVKEHRLLILYGPGGNGKSVMANTIASIMGGYHKEAMPKTFVEGRSREHETAMAFVSDARFVTSGETDQGGALNEATVKRATGADTVTARFLYRNPFSYKPRFKIWVTTNHLPRLKSVGPDMRRRIHVLELDYIPARPDHDLERKLAEEYPGILAWMIEGAQAWFDRGLDAPDSIMEPTNRYFSEQDTLGSWIEEKTHKSGKVITPSSVLCASYNRFLYDRGLPSIDKSVFGRMLSARGYESKNVKVKGEAERGRCYVGIRLRNT